MRRPSTAKKHALIDGKGVLNNRISEYIFQRLGEIGVPTHFVKRLNMREQLIREVEIIPLEVVVRNVAAGSLSTRLGLEEGTQLPRSIIEFYYKNDKLNDPMVSEEHITAFGWATPQEIDEVMSLALRINDFLVGLFLGIGIRLVDFKVEFGRLWEANDQMRIVLADEISPDCCRLWDITSGDKLDKDRFRRDLGGVLEAYHGGRAPARRADREPAPEGLGPGAGLDQRAEAELMESGNRECPVACGGVRAPRLVVRTTSPLRFRGAISVRRSCTDRRDRACGPIHRHSDQDRRFSC